MSSEASDKSSLSPDVLVKTRLGGEMRRLLDMHSVLLQSIREIFHIHDEFLVLRKHVSGEGLKRIKRWITFRRWDGSCILTRVWLAALSATSEMNF